MSRTKGASEKIRIAAVKSVLSGQKQNKVAEIFDVWPTAVCNWMRLYRKRGFDALKSTKPSGRPEKLTARQKKELSTMLDAGAVAAGFPNELWTGKRVAEVMEKTFRIQYHHQYVPTLLKELGFSLQKPMKVAREKDSKKARRWVRTDFPEIKKKLN